MLRCAHCAGTFVPRPLLESFLATVPAEAADSAYRTGAAPHADRAPPRPAGVWDPNVVYRMCPVCDEPMHRQNFARRSGVLVDVCPVDGTWFDAGEASSAAAWVRELPALREQERAAARSQRAESLRPAAAEALLALLGK